jgi:hypothetical protein
MKVIDLFSYLSSSIIKPKIFFIIASITIFALIIDVSINQIYYLNINEFPIDMKVILFLLIGAISLIGQYTFIQFVKNKSIDIRKSNVLRVKTLSRIAYFVQSVLTILFLIVIFQMSIATEYSVLIMIFSIGISYLFGGSMMILLASKFFSWFRSHRNIVVLLYGISSAIIASNIAFTAFIVIDLLLTRPDMIQPHFGWEFVYSHHGTLTDVLLYGDAISSIAGFIFAWISTILLLRQFSVRWKGKAHWIIVTIPLAYFLIQFQPLFLNIFSEFLRSEPVTFGILHTLIITYSKPIGGLIFGAAFWTITKSLRRDSIMMDYTTISAYGFILLFISNQALVLSSTSYPPFGFATINFLGLSCYMVLVGIYSSAISVSQNATLRQSIRKLVLNESKLLDSIGTAQMEQELQKRVLKVTKEQEETLMEQTGVQSSLNEADLKKYLSQVIEELERTKNIEDKA